ncbi:hypothetical protein PR048_025548 [Dryococelus australis]|uniref:Uncharacterized protein n=1 Tax=Dryococelus australis TaxID=614101 RepID=A0ABQ9GRL4_9NEOP|nr:hypothetical protein PR048_025548 [Dryococelus australis]
MGLNELKAQFAKYHELARIKLSKRIYMQLKASYLGAGVVLNQLDEAGNRLINCYVSAKFRNKEMGYHSKETQLEGKPFTPRTIIQICKWLDGMQDRGGKLSFDFRKEHELDTLSCNPNSVEIVRNDADCEMLSPRRVLLTPVGEPSKTPGSVLHDPQQTDSRRTEQMDESGSASKKSQDTSPTMQESTDQLVQERVKDETESRQNNFLPHKSRDCVYHYAYDNQLPPPRVQNRWRLEICGGILAHTSGTHKEICTSCHQKKARSNNRTEQQVLGQPDMLFKESAQDITGLYSCTTCRK